MESDISKMGKLILAIVYIIGFLLSIFFVFVDDPGFYPNTIFAYGAVILYSFLWLAILPKK